MKENTASGRTGRAAGKVRGAEKEQVAYWHRDSDQVTES